MPRKIILEILRWIWQFISPGGHQHHIFFSFVTILVYIILWNTKVNILFIFDILNQQDKYDVCNFPNWCNHINGKPLFHTQDNEWRCKPIHLQSTYIQIKYDCRVKRVVFLLVEVHVWGKVSIPLWLPNDISVKGTFMLIQKWR